MEFFAYIFFVEVWGCGSGWGFLRCGAVLGVWCWGYGAGGWHGFGRVDGPWDFVILEISHRRDGVANTRFAVLGDSCVNFMAAAPSRDTLFAVFPDSCVDFPAAAPSRDTIFVVFHHSCVAATSPQKKTAGFYGVVISACGLHISILLLMVYLHQYLVYPVFV